MNILVTGANGFVGAAVCRALLNQAYEVRAMTRRDSDLSNLESLPVALVTGDLRDAESLKAAIKGCAAVFHVAADYRLWVRNPTAMYDINVQGTKRVIETAMTCGIDRVVYTSSVAALASYADGSVSDENTPTNESDMIGHYKRSKYLAEKCVIDMVHKQGAPVVIVNPSTPLGPGEIKPTPTGRIIRDAMHGRIPAFVDTGLNVVHVDDVAAGHIAAFEKGVVGRRYILGGENLSLQELLTLVAEAVGRRPPSVAIPHSLAMLFAYGAEAVAYLTDEEPRATIDGVRMSRKKMFFSSDCAATELGYRWRPAEEAVRDAVSWFSGRH